MYSLVIPVYRNEASIPELLACIASINDELKGQLETVFVVDGSPDRCFTLLEEALPNAGFAAKLILLSRNFGAFPAIRTGLAAASGKYFAVMAADLQEPPSLVLDFFNTLRDEPVDVVVGVRSQRDDPWLSRVPANIFWGVYRRFVQREMPPGGVDVFGCNAAFRNHLVNLEESNSSLVGLIYWLGFRRKTLSYKRLERTQGRSAWTIHKKIAYLMDSLFSFSDLPIRVLIAAGLFGLAAAACLSILVVTFKLSGWIEVPGYAATAILIVSFGALNALGLGIIGSYAWRAYENTKGRPHAVALIQRDFKIEEDT